MTRRCAIYARFSSDLQRESSIDDQFRQCREFASRQGWVIVEEFVIADFSAILISFSDLPKAFLSLGHGEMQFAFH